MSCIRNVGFRMLLLLAATCLQSATGSALNGFGKPVDWWLILKFPQQMLTANGTLTTAHCPDSACPYHSLSRDNLGRKSGLCYLYADSTSPTLKPFNTLNFDCLGQGRNDPLSQTLLQAPSSNESDWAFFNDQLNGMNSRVNASYECTGESKFNAHSKGFVWRDSSGGVYLQSTTPNFPDPSASSSSKFEFIPLGMQHDNNIKFAQQFFAISLNNTELERMSFALENAGQCSNNFYSEKYSLNLVSSSLVKPNSTTRQSNLYKAFVSSKVAKASSSKSVSVSTRYSKIPVKVFVKSPRSIVPPWAWIANEVQTDISVASWWDSAYGIPTICATDDYENTYSSSCLVDPSQNMKMVDGKYAAYNVENIIQASFDKTYYWNLLGGTAGGNHAKWGLTTSRNYQSEMVFMGDMNMEGYPCSRHCSGSQGGRGGVFFAVQSASLWQSLYQMITSVCSCVPHTSNVTRDFVSTRMCNHGCSRHIEKNYNSSSYFLLPQMSSTASSFWNRGISAVVALE